MSLDSNSTALGVIDAAVLNRLDLLSEEYAAGSPFRHVVIPNFLEPAFCRALLAEFPTFDPAHALNEMGQVGGKAVRTDVASLAPSYRALDSEIRSQHFLDVISRITGVADLLFDPDYVGGGTHENRNGQGLDAHIDFNYHPATGWHRRLNLIVYLNPQWQSEWGGELELHSDPWNEGVNQRVRIGPAFNKCVIFETTEHSWHGFSQIRLPSDKANLSRKSFAIYLYTRERPKVETATSHATVYVPEAMPLSWHPGRMLSSDDLKDLQDRFARLVGHLRFLYDREREFTSHIRTLESALADARSTVKLEVQGYATQPKGVIGYWSDGWAAEILQVALNCSLPARTLQLELWVPPQIASGQRVWIRVGDSEQACDIESGGTALIEVPINCDAGVEVNVRIKAQQTWIPNSGGASADGRALAYRIVRIAIVHER